MLIFAWTDPDSEKKTADIKKQPIENNIATLGVKNRLSKVGPS